MNTKLHTARKMRLWSIAIASQKVGVSELTYSRWENGKQKPHLSSLNLLCEAFSMVPEELGFADLVETFSVMNEQMLLSEAQTTFNENRLIDEQVTSSLFLHHQGDDMSNFDISRRATLQQLAGATLVALGLTNPEPLEQLSQSLVKPSYIDEAAIEHFEKLTEACWGLSGGSELNTAGQILSGYLPKLIQLAQQPSKYQKRASSIVSQGLELTSIVVAHRLDLSSKETYCQQAVLYGKLAENRNIQVTAMVELAVAFLYEKQLAKALKTFQQTLQYIQHVSPLIQARVYIGLGDAYARYGNKQEALQYIGRAYEVFPNHPERDPAFLFADCPLSLLALYEGQAHLNLGHPKAAWNAFSSIQEKLSLTKDLERIRIEVVNHQALAAIHLRDIERSTSCIKSGVLGAIAIESQKRYNEAYDAYKLMSHIWPNESQVKTLDEYFRR